MSYYVSYLSMIDSNKKITTNPVYFSTNSQDVIFQTKYYAFQGLQLSKLDYTRYYLSGTFLEDIDIRKLNDITFMARSISSYKKQLPNYQIIKEKIE